VPIINFNLGKWIQKLRELNLISKHELSVDISNMMVDVCELFMCKFHAVYGYTHSDELVIIIPSCPIKKSER
jgi:tRNA(His) 5'-end guanylyltransferase